MDELKVFTGNAHPNLAIEVCEYLNIPIGQADIFEFSNENIFVRFLKCFQTIFGGPNYGCYSILWLRTY